MILQYAILGFLLRSPLTGYQLGKLFNNSLKLVWVASLSQIYRELGALEKNGLVTSRGEKQADRRSKVIYTITAAGESAFQNWLNTYPAELFAEKRDEFMLRMFFGAAMEKAELKNHLQHFIAEQQKKKKAIETAIEKPEILMKNQEPSAAPEAGLNDLCLQFLFRRARMSTDTLLHWAEQCLAELEQL